MADWHDVAGKDPVSTGAMPAARADNRAARGGNRAAHGDDNADLAWYEAPPEVMRKPGLLAVLALVGAGVAVGTALLRRKS